MTKPRRPVSAVLTALALLAAACSGSSDNGDNGSSSADDESAVEVAPSTPTTEAPPLPEVLDVSGASGFSNHRADIIGNPVWATGPGNVPVSADSELAIRFNARRTGKVERVAFNLKYDFEREGYHGGTCGRLQVSLRPNDAGNPAETVLGSLVVDDPCGGERDIGWLVDLAFDEPIQLVGAETYHLVFTNLDPDPANYHSINLLYRPDDAGHARELSTGDGVLTVLNRGSQYWSGNDTGDWGASAVLEDHYPAFELTFAGGERQGVSYVGTRVGQEVLLDAESPIGFRQLFTPLADATLDRIWFRGVEASDDAEVDAKIALSSGEHLWQGRLTRDGSWLSAMFDVPLTVTAGREYAVEITGAVGQVEVRPLYQAQHDDWASDESSDWAGTRLEFGAPGAWEPYVGSIPHDLSLFFDADPGPTPTATGPRVVAYGDSLLGEPIVESTLTEALSARGMELASLDSEPGRTATQLADLLETSTVDGDVYLINIGINGEESAAQFEAQVRRAVAALQSAAPDAAIIWSNIHALPTRYAYIVDERVTPRNEVLRRLGSEGLIEVVDWATIATAHPEIYGTDGVHFFGSEPVYLATMLTATDTVTR